MKAPVERFLEDALKEFEQERQTAGPAEGARKERIRGAKQFVAFLLGRAPKKYERS